MQVSQIVEVLRVRRDIGSGEDHTCAIDENVQASELFSQRQSYIDEILIIREFGLNGEAL